LTQIEAPLTRTGDHSLVNGPTSVWMNLDSSKAHPRH
jgi:hypothetical protein